MEVISCAFVYEQLEEVGAGEGLNSRVFRANDHQHGGEIAVKEIPKTKFADPSTYFAEAKAMNEADCPNVLPIRVASATGDRICIVMPYLRKGSLLRRIKSAPLSLKDTVQVAHGMLKGLGQIHQKGMIHFDVKPSNILFSDTNEALVADFGQACRVGLGGVVQVPLMYFRARPPETIIHRHGTSAVDIYQAGVTLYRAVNGEPVYEEQIACFDDAGLEAAILSGDFPNRQGYLPHVPLWIRKVLNKAMSIDPAKRFHSASDFMHDFGKRINLNWRTTFCGGGEIDWVADRRNRRSLLIRLRGSGNSW